MNGGRVELRQLEHFMAVADERHFTRAARRVHIVQSGLSASIRSLEEELGTPLFVRSTRRVDLTAAGQLLYAKASAVLSAVRSAREALVAYQRMERGSLSIGTAQNLAAFVDLPDVLGRFHAEHPGIEIHMSQGGSASLLERVRDGRVDVACVPFYGEAMPGVRTELIACEALVLACAPGHPLARRRRAPKLADLVAHPFVDFEADWGTRRLVDRAFAAAGLDRRIAFEVSDLGTQLDLVSKGLGVALVPEAIAAARTRGGPGAVAMVELGGAEICWELVVAYADHADGEGRVPANPAARAFLDKLIEARAPLLE